MIRLRDSGACTRWISFLVALTSTAAWAEIVPYQVTQISLPSGAFNVGNAINEAGQVVGTAELELAGNPAFAHAFFYSTGAPVIPNGLEGVSRGWAINNAGHWVGQRDVCPSGGGCFDGAFLFDGQVHDLPTGSDPAVATAINDLGEVVGFRASAAGGAAFLYRGGTMTQIGTLGGCSSYAFDMNNGGRIVGKSASVNHNMHAFAYEATANLWRDLGTLGGTYSAAYAVNEDGTVVGESATVPRDGSTQAFVWRNGVMTALGTLGGTYSAAYDINESGQIIGESMTAQEGAPPHAFLYDDDRMVDLNDLVGRSWLTFTEARGINDAGQIVGTAGRYDSYGDHVYAVVLTPLVHEPGDLNLDGQVNVNDVAGFIEALLSRPVSLGGRVFWTETISGTIGSAGRDGTSLRTVLSGLTTPVGLAVDQANNRMYWGSPDLRQILTANLDGSNPERFAPLFGGVAGLALDSSCDQRLYWADPTNGMIWGDSAGAIQVGGAPVGIAVDSANGYVYWTSAARLSRVHVTDRVVQPLVTQLGNAKGVALDSARRKVYWTDAAAGTIQRANLDGAHVETLVRMEIPGGPTSLAIDAVGSRMYWTAGDVDGRIQRARLDGSGVQNVVTGLQGPYGLALDDTAPGCGRADMNGDGRLDGLDIRLFVRAIVD